MTTRAQRLDAQLTEQVDALFSLGADPNRYLVVPRTAAAFLMLPCLTLFGDLIGIIFGAIYNVGIMGVNGTVYVRNTLLYLQFWDVASGLTKAAGFGVILVETVGVGLSETAVDGMVDFFVLVLISGAGDELQGIKRGVMEMADLVAINKADGSNVQAAEMARSEAEHALHFFPAPGSGWTPRAIACSAQTGRGIELLWQCACEHHALTEANGWLERSRRTQTLTWMQEIIEMGLRQRFETHPAVHARMKELERDVAAGRVSSFHAARELLEIFSK